ncbi:MAG TPA: gluconate 2-dehydrogenase subunit 3 family protein [Candidatus Margulisiibacteriota bacterium]|nr:gluconate 2-dehydrogenase subunit 3 family protein [Candidatus Margulisiibacteriota bacterium]
METTRPHWTLSRRSFLRYSAVTAGLLTLSRLRMAPALAVQAATATELRVLTPHQADILTAIVERITFTGADTMPAVHDTQAIVTIDQALLQLDPSVQSQVGWLLRLFQWGPPVFQLKFRTFTGLTPEERDSYLQGWATSRSSTRRLAFRALKNLSMLGYYSQDATWKGIHYDGPWLPRPRRVIE